MRANVAALAAIGGLLFVGCASESTPDDARPGGGGIGADDDDDPSTEGETPDEDDDGGTTGGESPDDEDDDDDDDDGPGGPAFDLGSADDGSTTTGEMIEGCQAVDFLFVIDNSVSMGGEQEALVGAFPGFMSTIVDNLEAGSDFHVMVLDTDAWGRCDTANPWDGATPSHNTCNAYIQQTVFDECDRVRGAGVLHPAGDGATNAPCTPSSGKRFIDSTEPDLAGTFACMATVGLAGHASERPMNAIQAALDSTNVESQTCNEGFLRDDALLVVTFVSDDGGTPDEGTPMEWYQSVIAAKNNDPAGVVVLGLGPGGADCGGGGEHWLEFVQLWGENGLHGPVCGTAEDYVSFFTDAVSTIDQACQDFEPPG